MCVTHSKTTLQHTTQTSISTSGATQTESDKSETRGDSQTEGEERARDGNERH